MTERPYAPGKPRSGIATAVAADLASCVLLLITPFAIFVRHHSLPVLQTGTLACFLILAGVGLVLGVLATVGGSYLRVPIVSLLLTLFIDIQWNWLTAWNTRLLATLFAVSLVSWGLRAHLTRIVTVAFSTLFVSTLLLPVSPGSAPETRLSSGGGGNRDLPVVLHLILDGHIGIEGIPAEFDPDQRVANSLRQFYLQNGFQVFGRAFSPYGSTRASLPNLVNFTASDLPFEYTYGGIGRKPLKENAYFEEMTRRGYEVHVYQNGNVDFCRVPRGMKLARCFTKEPEALESIGKVPLPPWRKVKVIFGVYSRLSFIVSNFGLPFIFHATLGDLLALRVSAISAVALFEQVTEEIAEASPGSLFFVHVLLPHSPYTYDRSCAVRPDPSTWLLPFRIDFDRLKRRDEKEGLSRNDAESRAVRYPLYLQQVECTQKKVGELFERMKAAGVFDNAMIMVHADHGSQIALFDPGNARASPADFIDTFSVLFAVKLPGQGGGYDRRLLPLDALFRSVVQEGSIPDGTDWAGPPTVRLGRVPRAEHREMPAFSHGRVD